MQIPRIWKFLEAHMTRTPQHSKKEICRPQSAHPGKPVGGFFIIQSVLIGGYAWSVSGSLVVLVNSFPHAFQLYLPCNQRKENDTWPPQRTSARNVELNI